MTTAGLLERIQREAEAETDALIAEVAERAREIARILYALNLDAPARLRILLGDESTTPPTPPDALAMSAGIAPPMPPMPDAPTFQAEIITPPPTPDPIPQPDRLEQILAALSQGPLTHRELANALDLTEPRERGTLNMHIGRLRRHKRIRQDPTNGKYEIVVEPAAEPAADGWPVELRDMPAATGAFKAQKVAAARGQRATLDDVNAHESVIGTEIARRLGIPPSRAASYLRQLADAGLIRRTGRNRHDAATPPSTHMGKASIEYAPLTPPGSGNGNGGGGAAPPSVGPESDVDRAATDAESSDSSTDQNILNTVRAAIRSRAGRDFGAAEVAMETGLEVTDVGMTLQVLAACGAVTPGSQPDTFHYEKPVADATTERAVVNGNGRARAFAAGAAVAGTGRGGRGGTRSSDGGTNAVIAHARRRFGDQAVRKTGTNHYVITLPGGESITVGGNQGIAPKDRSRLRRAGLDV